MKKFAALMLAGVLAVGLAAPAFAAGDTITIPVSELEPMPVDVVDTSLDTDDLPLLIAPNPNADGEQMLISPAPDSDGLPPEVDGPLMDHYAIVLKVNGEVVDTSFLPEMEGIPMRVLANNDYADVYWDEETGTANAYFEGGTVSVDAATGAVQVDFEPAEGFYGVIKNGVTFLPVALIDSLEGYSVAVETGEDGQVCYSVTTPNGAPIVKAAYEIRDAADCWANWKSDTEFFTSTFGLSADTFEEGVMFMGMNTNADMMMLAKLSATADEAAVQKAMEDYLANQKETFTWYLGATNLPKIEAARSIIKDGYVLLLIADPETVGAGEEAFNAYVAAQTAAE